MFDMKVFKSSPEKIIKIHLRYFFNEHLSSAAYIFLYSKNWKSWKKCQLGATLPPSHVKHKKNMWKRKVVLVPLGYILTGPRVKNWFWELSKIGQCPPAETLWYGDFSQKVHLRSALHQKFNKKSTSLYEMKNQWYA